MSDVAVATEAKQDFPYFTEEHEMIRQTVKRFCREEIAPYAEEWDHAGIFPKELFKKAANLGLFGIRIDPEWGGLGLDWWATAAFLEAMAHADSGSISMALMVQSEITLPVLDELGTRDQKEEFLRPAVAGDMIAALGISEPGGGSDVAALKTRARIDGDELVISGQKLWITNGTRADFIILAVRTGGEGHKGVSLVLFPTKTKGFSVGKKLKKVGNMASDTAELFFDECRIPARYIARSDVRHGKISAVRVGLWSRADSIRPAHPALPGLAAPFRRASHQHRSWQMAYVSRAGFDESRPEVRARSHHGQALHVGVVAEGHL